MKLGIQGWYLNEARTGIGRHTEGLLSELKKRKNLELVVVTPKNLKPWKIIPNAGLRKWIWERIQAPRAFAKKKVDAVYFPYPCPLAKHAPYARMVTVHDTLLWDDERYQGSGFKRFYHKLARKSLQRADTVFAVSKATQKELKGLKSKLLPNGLSLKTPAKINVKKFAKKDQRALIYWGGFDLRKHVPDLAKLLHRVHLIDPRFELWIVGKAHHQSELYPAVPKLSGVQMLGDQSDDDLKKLSQKALAFVHASDAEGFNLPLLEAQALGLPAIVWDLPVNHEVSKESAVFFSTFNPSEFFAKLKELDSSAVRQALAKAGKVAADSWTWKSSADQLVQTLEKLHAQHH